MWRRLKNLLRINGRTPQDPIRPKVTPDPAQAAELAKRQEAVAYSPENGLHKNRQQERLTVVK